MRQVVVTGGGTGIGLAIAGEFVRAGDQVTITGRREGVLKEAVTVLRALAEGAAGHSGTGATADRTTALAAQASTTARPASGLTLGSEFFGGRLTDERQRRLIAETRTGRAGTTKDIAATVMFLASPAAGHVTGQVIHVNGGSYLGL